MIQRIIEDLIKYKPVAIYLGYYEYKKLRSLTELSDWNIKGINDQKFMTIPILRVNADNHYGLGIKQED